MLGTVVQHAVHVHPVEEVVDWGVLPVEHLGSLILGLGLVVILLRDGVGTGGQGAVLLQDIPPILREAEALDEDQDLPLILDGKKERAASTFWNSSM